MVDAVKPGSLMLYGSSRSPFVRKVRIVLHEKALVYDWCTDYYEFLADLNPLGKVPVLQTSKDGLIYDSPVICEYLESISPLPGLIPREPMQRLEVRRWEALADGICDAAVLIVNEKSREVANERSDTWIAHQQNKVELALEVACATLGSRPYCYLNDLSLADIALGSALGYVSYRLPHLEWQTTYPALADYLDCIETRASFSSTKPC